MKALILILLVNVCLTKETNIAIIGAGIGGAYAANLLAKFNIKNKAGMKIHLFDEANGGGRIETKSIDSRKVEVGATFLIKENKLVYELVKSLGLTLVENSSDDQSIGLWSGKAEFETYFPTSLWLTLPKMVYRYGLSVFRAKIKLSSFMEKFTKIYDYFESGYHFKSTSDFLSFIEMKEYISKTFEEILLELGCSPLYGSEFLNGVISSLYNQDVKFNGFVGFVTLAALFNPAYRVKEGNSEIIKRLLEKTEGFIFRKMTKIDRISKNGDHNDYTLFSEAQPTLSNERFDYVIIANPNLDYQNTELISPNIHPFNFQETHVYYIGGELRFEKFGLTGANEIPRAILSTKIKATNFSEFIRFGDTLYKIQTETPITLEQLSAYFRNPVIIQEKHWLKPYPKLIPLKEAELPTFRLGETERIFRINSIECLAAAMEMSLIGAKNVVNLVVSDFIGYNPSLKTLKKGDL